MHAPSLYHHEQMRTAAEEERCEIAVGMMRERLVHAGKPAMQLSARVLAPALRRFARHSLVQIERGFEAQDHEMVVVTPLIEKVLPPDRIQEIEHKVKAYMTSRAAGAEEADADAESDGTEEESEEGSE